MDAQQVEYLARRLVSGELRLDDFVAQVASPRTADLGDAQLDLDRQRRCGYPEVVFGQGKPIESLEKIFQSLLDNGIEVLSTRIDEEKADHLLGRFPSGRYNRLARTFRIPLSRENRKDAKSRGRGRVVIVTAGTSDAAVAAEAFETADWMGADTILIQDVGVAGPHRLPAHLSTLRTADAIVVVAGMEGALPSVVGGYVDCAVIAVPTSIGYGASFSGVAALLSMLNSCAANIAVVNIDAGFKAGYLAALIAARTAGREYESDSI